MAPTPFGTASCMYSPRRLTVRTASAKPIAPAATSAEYSPRLCPATQSGRAPRATRGRRAATLDARMAGCVFAVSCSSASGPSKQSRERAAPRAASASSNTARLSGNASARAFPIPTT